MVISKSEPGAVVHSGGVAVGVGSDRSADMLSVALKSQVDESRLKVVMYRILHLLS